MARNKSVFAADAVVGFGIVVTVLLAPAISHAQQPPGPSAAVKSRIEEAQRSTDSAKAMQLMREIVEATEGDHVEALYAAARLHAGAGDREGTYLLLNRAVGAGFLDRSRLLEDEAFADYRGEPLFQSLARKAWANGYVWLLERPNREDVQKSPRIMKALAFKPGERVADIGAGSGYFTFQVAEAVGPTGSVRALDIAPEMLEYLGLRVKARKAGNITLQKVSSDDPQLPPASVDTILMIDTIHYVKDRTAYAKKLLPALAPRGRLVVIDYVPKPMSERPWGPPPEQQFPREQLDREMAAAGFEVAAVHDFLPEQFFVIYQAASTQPSPQLPAAVRQACDLLVSLARHTRGVKVERTTGPFEDERDAITRSGCSVSVTGSWAALADGRNPFESWREALEKQGWHPDLRHDADGPDGTAFAYVSGGVICLFKGEWDGGDDEQPDAPRDDAYKGRGSCAAIGAGGR